MDKIFINYRHDDLQGTAWALYFKLEAQFGAENVFFDNGTLRPGMQWFKEIESHLANGGAFIALIGPGWMSSMATHLRRDDVDYVAKEIDLALRSPRVTVIPALVDNAAMPGPGDLSRSLKALPDCQAEHLRHTHLLDDIERLMVRLREIGMPVVPDVAGRPGPERAPDQAEPERAAHEAGPEPAPAAGNGEPGTPGHGAAERTSGPARKTVPSQDVLPADDRHYQMVMDEAQADNLVVFLGAGVNADDREGPFRPDSAMLPDDIDLSNYLADKARLKSELRGLDLAEVAQYIREIRGEPNVFRWARQVLVAGSEPGPVHRYPVHRYLASLPKRLEELGSEKRYQMIVTSKYDTALEQAFQEAGEPFDVAVYMAPGTDNIRRFVHISWEKKDPRTVTTPNDDAEFPFVAEDGRLTRTVIVRINGTVDDPSTGYRPSAGYDWRSNYVITEDHYIDYMGDRPAEKVVPMQILAKLREASCLFLGYTMADWRLRVFLHWIWKGDKIGGSTHWAVERDPDPLEQRFWQRIGVSLYKSRLTDYVQGLDTFLFDHRDELT